MNEAARKDGVDLYHLRCLITMVELGTATKAAARLGVSQPALSHVLQKLRKALGDPLLVRVGMKMMPTPRAQELVEQARLLIRQADEVLWPKAPFEARSYEGRWVVSAPEYVDYRLTPALARALHLQSPASSLQIVPPNPAHAERMLESGEIDLRLGWVDKSSPFTRSRLLYTETFSCLYRRQHRAVKGLITIPQYLAAEHIRVQASQPSTATRTIAAAALRLGQELRVALVVPNLMTVGRVVAESDTVATVPSGIGQVLAQLHDLKIAPLPIKVATLNVAMYWHERMQTDKRHRWLRSLIAETAAELKDPPR
ncbi:MAG: LysR family transcriptional regulator [Betaproteobacteria bacterium]|nr:LysR family transcriptional regulator [Betaproteobacteria bacterium]